MFTQYGCSDEEDQRLMSSFLPLLQEFIPSAAEEIESQMDYQVIKQGLTLYFRAYTIFIFIF